MAEQMIKFDPLHQKGEIQATLEFSVTDCDMEHHISEETITQYVENQKHV